MSKFKLVMVRLWGWNLLLVGSVLAVVFVILVFDSDISAADRAGGIFAAVIFGAVAFGGFKLTRHKPKNKDAKEPAKGEPDMRIDSYAWYEAKQVKVKKENSTYADREGQKPKPEIERHAEKKEQERIEELANLILHYQGSYYNGEAEISDTEFDILWDELKSLAPNHPVIEEIAGPTRKTRKSKTHSPSKTTKPSAKKPAAPRGKPVTIFYADYKNNITERDIEILDIYEKDKSVYIRAFCHLRGEMRVFLASRIQSMTCNGQPVEDIEGFFDSGFVPLSGEELAKLALGDPV